MNMIAYRFAVLFFLAFSSLQAQTLRGTVRDLVSGDPLPGASIQAYKQDQQQLVSRTQADVQGKYLLDKLSPGYYQIRVGYSGYDDFLMAEILVAAGKETIVEVVMDDRSILLQGPVITARTREQWRVPPPSEIPLTRDQTLRFPVTFFDPARLATAYPGVAQTDDGTNSLSIRGNSPASVQWKLEGADIVNPNHLPNAGINNDRPAAASGGTLMFSAQMLDNSSLLVGALPAGYGDAPGGVMDIGLRRGNNKHHEFTAQAGLVGLDLAAEGPLGKKGASYLANYRYSTVGLLGQLGVSFGGESISFQDLAFHAFFPGQNGGGISVFGMGGLSNNNFAHKADTADILVDKDRYNIDFQSKTGVFGASGKWHLGNKRWLKASVATSTQDNEWLKNLPPQSSAQTDFRQETKNTATVTAYQDFRKSRISIGALARFQRFSGLVYLLPNELSFDGVEKKTLLQPWARWEWNAPNGKWSYNIGVQGLLRLRTAQKIAADPRASLTFRPRQRHVLTLAAAQDHQEMPVWMPIWYIAKPPASNSMAFSKSQNVSLRYAWAMRKSLKISVEAYFQQQQQLPVRIENLGTGDYKIVSVFNAPEYIRRFIMDNKAAARNKGIEFNIERPLTRGWYGLANFSLFDSKINYAPDDGFAWTNSRWDIGHLANLAGGKEWQKEKKSGKTRTLGIGARAVWTGGVREPAIDISASREVGTTVYNEYEGFQQQYPDYFRLDARFYWKKSLAERRNSTFALEFQNLTNHQNVAYHYYDAYLDNVETKFQLGLIPNLSWRVEF